MSLLKYTLVSDGSTDANLIPIINWTLEEMAGVILAEEVRAEFWRLLERPTSLEERIWKALELYPCEALFIHRDAEKEAPERRNTEIQMAAVKAAALGCGLPVVAIIPVRMLEAWLLFNEWAIRQAAGNPNGKVAINLPALKQMEDRPDPKSDLSEALRTASELKGRRLKKFDTAYAFWRIVDFLDDFTPLRQLPAYLAFESTVHRINECRWAPGFYRILDEPSQLK